MKLFPRIVSSTDSGSELCGLGAPAVRFCSEVHRAHHAAAMVLCGCRQQIAHSHQVVDRQSKGEHPAHPCDSTMTSLAQSGDSFEPAEDLFDPFALALTYRVARMAGGAGIDRAVGLARDVRGDLMVAQLRNELLAVSNRRNNRH